MGKLIMRLAILFFVFLVFGVAAAISGQDVVNFPMLGQGWYKVETPSGKPYLMFQNDKYMARIRLLTYSLKEGINPLPKERMEYWIKGMKKRNEFGKNFTEIQDGTTTIDGLPTYWKTYRHGKGKRQTWEKNYLAITKDRKVVHLRFTALGEEAPEEGLRELDDWVNEISLKK